MALSDLNLKISYRSKGDDNIVDKFLNPALEESVIYKRSAGFFSSSVYEIIGDGLKQFIQNKGKIFLICSPELSKEDIDSIREGYRLKNEVIRFNFEEDLKLLDNLSVDVLDTLTKLIENDILQVKIISVNEENEFAIYHDKIGIFEDSIGNKIVFVGSANETKQAYLHNYEKIRLSFSWKGEEERIADDEDEFDEIWNEKNPYVSSVNCEDIIIKHIKNTMKKKGNSFEEKTGISVRDYQNEAVEAWLNNDKNGFLVMATGTGKTWTALLAAHKIASQEDIFLTICAPYKHLVRQWYEDVKKIFPNNTIVMISSENLNWTNELSEAIMEAKYSKTGSVIAISTIVSFGLDKFERIVSKTNLKRMLIVDEAHRFKLLTDDIQKKYAYKLGLSATPASKRNDENAQKLMNYFGGKVFDLPIEYAIKKGYLVGYNYYPILVNATKTEEEQFEKITKQMIGCFRGNVCIDIKKLGLLKQARLRVISMASEKIDKLEWILSQVRENNHFIVYCGDGKLFGENISEGIRHIQYIKEQLSQRGFKVSQFTAEENIKERMELVDSFNRGLIDSMVAIRCLDEGINIPSINGALLLSSNDDLREFIQRRGRILRTYKNEYSGEKKTEANIYDVIVLPDENMKSFAKIELSRYYEYARLSKNDKKNMQELEDLLIQYDLTFEDIIDIEESEDELDD